MASQTFGAALGRLVFQKRKALGLTQTQLAEDAFGKSGKTRRISELENGTVENPHPKTIDPIIAELKISEAELLECAKQANSQPDADLDRAYREARNLIEAIAKQFEHSKPDATLAELDRFLRAKAREWIELRERIELIGVSEDSLCNLKSAATNALAEGNFEEADLLLSQAEEVQQENRTLLEVRKQADIRIARGDISLLRDAPDSALNFYLGAAEFFRPFDESEMVKVLHNIAGRIYETGRRSLKPSFPVAAKLLETALSTRVAQESSEKKSTISYRLGLIYRNACVVSDPNEATDYLEKAIKYSRDALSFLTTNSDSFQLASARIGLSNCLLEKAKRTKDQPTLRAAIELLKETRISLQSDAKNRELMAHACNNLGSALLERINLEEADPTDRSWDEALEAFRDAISASEDSVDPGVWGAAMANCGAILASRSRLNTSDPEAANFLRVRSIAAYLSAIETFPAVTFPLPFAEAQKSLANVFFDQAASVRDELSEFYLLRAIASYESASQVFSKERYPQRWARIQTQLASIFTFHAKIDGVETTKSDLEHAISYLQAASHVFNEIKSKPEFEYCEQVLTQIRAELANFSSQTDSLSASGKGKDDQSR